MFARSFEISDQHKNKNKFRQEKIIVRSSSKMK